MSGSLVQIRVDEDLKQKVTSIYKGLGLDLSSAVRMFFTRSVQVGGIPFSVREKDSCGYDEAVDNIMQIRSDSIRNGTSDLSLDQINAVISDCRQQRKTEK